MEKINIKELANRFYNFILKYDSCINKYKKQENQAEKDLLNITKTFNDILENEYIKPYSFLTKGREIEELEYILSSDKETVCKYMRIYDYLEDECFELGKQELEKYYLKHNITRSEDEIFEILEKYSTHNNFDETIFSEEVIEKNKLLKEYDCINKQLCVAYKNIIEKQEEWE